MFFIRNGKYLDEKRILMAVEKNCQKKNLNGRGKKLSGNDTV